MAVVVSSSHGIPRLATLKGLWALSTNHDIYHLLGASGNIKELEVGLQVIPNGSPSPLQVRSCLVEDEAQPAWFGRSPNDRRC